MRVLAAFVVLLALSSLVSAREFERVQYKEGPVENDHADFEEDRFRERRRLIHPGLVGENKEPQLGAPTVPEPPAAQAPKKSVVEEVTGLKEPAVPDFRFQQVHVDTGAYHAASTSDKQVAGDKKDRQLMEALHTVNDNIVSKATKIKHEKQWVGQVTKIMESYVFKSRRVTKHIRDMQKKVKELFRKKKQIQNMMVQRKLHKKLQVATKDLSTLQDALKNVQKKQTAFMKSKHEISATIGAIEQQMKKLRGEGKLSKKGKKKSKKAKKKSKKGKKKSKKSKKSAKKSL